MSHVMGKASFFVSNTVPRCNQPAIEPTRLGQKEKPARRCLSVDVLLGMGISVFKIQCVFSGEEAVLFGLFPGFAFVD